MKQSPLAGLHEKLGARMVPFAGWEMPIQYEGIVAEHNAVRNGVGVFDISHMAQFEVHGESAGEWINSLLCNDVTTLKDGEGQYTLMLNESGGVIDDLIIYRISAERFFLVLNASREEADWEWLSAHSFDTLKLVNRSAEFGAIAVQGKEAENAWAAIEPEIPLPPRNGISEHRDGDLILCRTGYTGEDGFELFAKTHLIEELSERLLETCKPCGLGARDTLRLEKCYPLYGNDLDEDHTPLEAGLGFFVKLDKEGGFTGCEALKEQKEAGLKRKLVAVKATGKAPPFRPGYSVQSADGEEIATLSSGGLSPTLGQGIGMAYLPVEMGKPGTELVLSIRDRTYPIIVVKKPFV